MGTAVTTNKSVITMAKAIHDAVLERVPGIVQTQVKVLHDDMTMLVGGIVRKELDSLRAQFNSHVEQLEKQFQEKTAELVEVMRMALKELSPRVTVEAPVVNFPDRAIQVNLEHLPVPVVNLPEKAIQVSMLPSKVIVPENAIQVKMKPSVVNIPAEAIRNEIQVSVKEANKKVEKSIVYGTTGRPEKIVETTTGD